MFSAVEDPHRESIENTVKKKLKSTERRKGLGNAGGQRSCTWQEGCRSEPVTSMIGELGMTTLWAGRHLSAAATQASRLWTPSWQRPKPVKKREPSISESLGTMWEQPFHRFYRTVSTDVQHTYEQIIKFAYIIYIFFLLLFDDDVYTVKYSNSRYTNKDLPTVY